MGALDALAFFDWSKNLVLDNGLPWVVEDFQAGIVNDIASGVPECLVVIPEANAKTTLMSGVGLGYAAQNERAKIPLAAASRDQAGLLFGQAQEFVIRSGLESEFRVYEGYRRIDNLRTGSRIQVFAADDRTGDGALFDLGLVDELHRHRDLRLWRTWRGKLDKRGGQLVGISTAGEPGSEFEQYRERMKAAGEAVRDGMHVRVVGQDSIVHDFSLPPDADIEDFELVKQANPLAAITVEKLERRFRSPSMTLPHWSRFVCNIATANDGSWLPAGAWDACMDADAVIPDGALVYVGVDIGLKKDSTALTIISELGDGRWAVRAQVYTPKPSEELRLEFIESEIRALCDRYEVLEVAYDPWGFNRSAELLLEDGLPMVEVPMTNERIVPASQDLYDAIVSERIAHAGDEILSAHVAAGVTLETERGWRIGKRKTRAPIDALVALVLAFSRAKRSDSSPVLEWVA
jgi:phage terminase large subunit-like protein